MEELTMPRTVRGMLSHYRAVGQYTQELYIGISGREGVRFFPFEDVGSIL